MDDFLIPGGLYRIYYGKRSKKKTSKPLPSYRAMILLVNFGGRRIFTHSTLQKEDSSKKDSFTYEAIEMERHGRPERFAITPRDVVKAVLLKRMKDMREWPLEAVRTYFSRRGVSRTHIDELYRDGMRLEDVDFARYHVRAALRTRRNQEKLKKKLGGIRPSSKWIEAEYNGTDHMDYLTFRLAVLDLEHVYKFGNDSGIERVIFKPNESRVDCYDSSDVVVHRMSPPWPPEIVREALERERARVVQIEVPRNWGGVAYSGNWTTTGSTSTS